MIDKAISHLREKDPEIVTLLNHFKIDDLYGIAESVLALLMKLGEPFAFDSDLICSINLFDECFCPNCIDQGDQDGC